MFALGNVNKSLGNHRRELGGKAKSVVVCHTAALVLEGTEQ